MKSLFNSKRGGRWQRPPHFGGYGANVNKKTKMGNNEEKKSGRGGRRAGAGRKKGSGNCTHSIAIRIPDDVAEILSKVGNRSAFIVEAIRYYARLTNEK